MKLLPVSFSTIAGLLLMFSLTGPVYGAENIFKRGLDLLRKKPTTTQTVASALTNEEIIQGLKEALSVGTEKVVAQLGRDDGFYADPAIHIPLPEQFDRISSALQKVGMSGTLDELELKLNRAAESATPVARQLFLDSVRDMTLTDAAGIYRGEKDAATQYFKSTMTPQLSSQMLPIVSSMLDQVGAASVLENIMERYNTIPFVARQDVNLDDYVVQKTMDGIFMYMANEEAAIRENPLARSTDILKSVFAR